MYFLGALTLFLAVANAAVPAERIVNKLAQFQRDAARLQGPASMITPLDAILDDFKVGGAYVGPTFTPRDRSYQTVACLPRA